MKTYEIESFWFPNGIELFSVARLAVDYIIPFKFKLINTFSIKLQ